MQFLGLHNRQRWHPDGQGEGRGHQELASSNHHQGTQRFLGFSIFFYRRFIHNYSSITSPTHQSIKEQAQIYVLVTSGAKEHLKLSRKPSPVHCFSSIQTPTGTFIVEVDASNTGVGAVLSQQQGRQPKLHPCCLLLSQTQPGGRNYDISNRELLAIKLALEKWRALVGGCTHPFIVLTDHTN